MKKKILLFAVILLFVLIPLTSAGLGYKNNKLPQLKKYVPDGNSTLYLNQTFQTYTTNYYGNVTNITYNITTPMDYNGLVMYNQTNPNGQNVTLGIGGWFKGLFSWFVTSINSYITASFNGTTLSIEFNETQLNNTIADYTSNLTGEMNYTYLALLNQSDNFTRNIEAENITARGYLMGQPLTGMLGSGLIQSIEDPNTYVSGVNITCSGLVCSYNSFKVRLASTTSAIVAIYCSINNGTFTATDNQFSTYYVDSNCAIQSTTYDDWYTTKLGKIQAWDFAHVVAHSGTIETSDSISLEQKRLAKARVINYYTNQAKVVSGFNFKANAWPYFNITDGKSIFGMDIVNVGSKNVTATGSEIELIGHNGTGTSWKFEDQRGINITGCDNGTTIITCTGNNWRRHFIFVIGYDDSKNSAELHQLYPLESLTYSSISNCLDTTTYPVTYTIPPEYVGATTMLYAYCAKRTDTSWTTTSLIDLRTVKTGTVTQSSSGGTTYTSDEVYINKNASDSFVFNESKMNDTIDARIPTGTANNSWNESRADEKFVPYQNANSNVNLNSKNLTNIGALAIGSATMTKPYAAATANPDLFYINGTVGSSAGNRVVGYFYSLVSTLTNSTQDVRGMQVELETPDNSQVEVADEVRGLQTIISHKADSYLNEIRGAFFQADVYCDNSTNANGLCVTNAYGLDNQLTHYGMGLISVMRGSYSRANSIGGGQVTNAMGTEGNVNLYHASKFGNITNAYGGKFSVTRTGDNTTITNSYGVYSQPLSAFNGNNQSIYGVYVTDVPEDSYAHYRDAWEFNNSRVSNTGGVENDWTNMTGNVLLYHMNEGGNYELPNIQQTDNGINMSGNVLLLHLNGLFEDDSGYTNDGINKGVTFTDINKLGSHGGKFDGNSYINVTNTPSLNLTGNMTVLIWVKEVKTYHTILCKNDYFVLKYSWCMQSTANGKYVVFISGNGSYTGAAKYYTANEINFSDQLWHQVGFTFNQQNSNLTLYGDGNILTTVKAQDTNITQIFSPNIPTIVGGQLELDKVYDFFNGTIDEVAIWNRTLTSNEIKGIFNKTSPLIVDYSGANIDAYGQGNVNCTKSPKLGTYSCQTNTNPTYAYTKNNLTLSSTFSINLWVKSDLWTQRNYKRILETGYNQMFYLGTDTTGNKFKLIVNNSVAPYGTAEGGVIQPNVWHMISATYNGSLGMLYYDGINVANGTFTYSGGRSLPLYIGSAVGGAGAGWNGTMDEIAIWNRTLNQSDFYYVYNEQLSRHVFGNVYNDTTGMAIKTGTGRVDFGGSLRVGTSTPDHAVLNSSSGDVMISRNLEVGGNIYYTGDLVAGDIAEYMDTVYSESMRTCNDVKTTERQCHVEYVYPEGEDFTADEIEEKEICESKVISNNKCTLKEGYVAEFGDGEPVCADTQNLPKIKRCVNDSDLTVVGWVNYQATVNLESKKKGAYPIVLSGIADLNVKNCYTNPISPGDVLVASADGKSAMKYPRDKLEQTIRDATATMTAQSIIEKIKTFVSALLDMDKYDSARFAKALGSCNASSDDEMFIIYAIRW